MDVQIEIKKCSGCKKGLPLDQYKYLQKQDRITARCLTCLEKIKKKNPPSTNILWVRYPELKEFAKVEEHPSITIGSKITMDFTCSGCDHVTTISPSELLQLPYCVSCGLCFLQRKSTVKNLIKQTENLILENFDYFSFNEQVKKLQLRDRGDIQEIFAKYYFESHRKHYNIDKYISRLLGDKLPDDISLGNKDVGTDGIILHENGKISLVQVKFRSDEGKYLQRECLGGMSLEALSLEEKFGSLFLFSNTIHTPKLVSEHEKRKVRYVMFDELQSCDWTLIQEWVKSDRTSQPTSFGEIKLLPWQKEARKFVLYESRDNGKMYARKNFGRKTVCAPTGAGKTVCGNSIANYTKKSGQYLYGKCLVTVPNLHLLSQWFERLASWNPNRNFLIIGSDLSEDEQTENIPYILTTNTEEISEFLAEKDDYIIICTYQSLDRLLDASPQFDLTLVDEAHLTCGMEDSNFTLVSRENFPSENILYMTATPKIYKGMKKEICVSMDDEKIFGDRYTYSLKKAIDDGIISDYKVVIGAGKLKEDQKVDHTDFNVRFLCESIKNYSIGSVLVCSTSHERSKQVYNRMKGMLKEYDISHELILMGKNATSAEKSMAINRVTTGAPCIIFNVRVFSLGSDIPSLESVMILGDRKSVIDIVQTVGRALRKHKNKSYAYILIPCLIEDEFEEDGSYYNVRKIISSLGTVDECLTETVVTRTKKGGRDILCMNVGTYEWSNEQDEKIDMKEFRLCLLDRFCQNRQFSPFYRFEILYEFCVENNRLPKDDEEYLGLKIGAFWDNLASKKRFKYIAESWIQKLMDISPNMKLAVERCMNNRSDPERKRNLAIKPEKRQEALENYCRENNRMPPRDEKYDGIKVGSFWNHLCRGDTNKSMRDIWLERLKNISSEIKLCVEKALRNKNNPEKINKQAIKPETRFEALWEYSKEYDKLPKLKGQYNTEINISGFWDRLASGGYKTKRDQWIQELKDISSNMKLEVETCLNHRNDPEKKKSRLFDPEERLVALKTFCKEYDRLPKDKEREKHQNIDIGRFLGHILGGKRFQKKRLQWIEELRDVSPNIRKQLETRKIN